MAVVAHIDWETKSACDLKAAGVHRYAEDPTTGAWCLSWCLGDGPVHSWKFGDPDPKPLLDHIEAGGIVVAHNMQFDRTVWNKVAPDNWPDIKLEQTDCTMARANAMGLPAALATVGHALGVKVQKDADGARLMMQMCKPRRTWKLSDAGGADAASKDAYPVIEVFRDLDLVVEWWHDDAKIKRLMQYCDTDILAEREVDKIVPQLSDRERAIWLLDQTINERGVAIDLELARAAVLAVAEARRLADARMWWLTDGDVKKCTETAKLVAWLNSRGISCESVAKGEIEEIVLAAEIIGDDAAEEAVRLRRQTSRTSTDKFKAMLSSVCADGRVRGTLAYHAAHTGRWAGRLIQPQNLPRVDADKDLPDVMRTINLLKGGRSASEAVTAIELLTGDVMGTLSKCLRAALVAPEGRMFVGGDFSNIEGRVNAWIAGEDWKVKAFEDYDAGTGPDLYKLAYARSFGVEVNAVNKSERQIGKVMELALGYQGGAGAFITMGANYGVRVSEERANELKQAWRTANAKITQSWWDLQDAAIAAVGTPGEKIALFSDKVVFLAANGFLFCKIPSGRVISFAKPKLIVVTDAKGRSRYQVEYEGLDTQTNRWGPLRLYGGLICNNVVQGTARDIMADAMLRVEAADWPVILTVHDELLCEIPFTNEDVSQQFAALMAELPAWAKGLPVAAAAWQDVRYVK